MLFALQLRLNKFFEPISPAALPGFSIVNINAASSPREVGTMAAALRQRTNAHPKAFVSTGLRSF
jgi:hypothetical protein